MAANMYSAAVPTPSNSFPSSSHRNPDLFDFGSPSQQITADENDLFDDDEDMGDTSVSPFGNSFSMPTENDNELGDLMKEAGGELDLNTLNDGELKLGGEAKDDAAVDYADISDDDDLPEDEGLVGGPVQQPIAPLPGIIDYASNYDEDDLFGDGPSSPAGAADGQQSLTDGRGRDEDELASEHEDAVSTTARVLDLDFDEEGLAQYRIQKALFDQSGQTAPTTQEENIEQWIKHDFPGYDRSEVPQFHKLFPPKPRQFVGKTPLKPPKPIKPTKVNLELDQDQKTSFNLNAPPRKWPWEGDDSVVVIEVPQDVEEANETTEEDSDIEEQLPGGVTMQDLEVMCADFDTLSAIAGSDAEAEEVAARVADGDADLFGFEDFADSSHPTKKRRLGMDPREIVSIPQYDMPNFDDPERLTWKLSRHVVLDLNDPQLLVEEISPEAARAKVQSGELNRGSKTVNDLLQERFNHSNDAEYDLLKQNHQHKIRSTLGNMSVEHSVPALRLQYPYYKVKLDILEARKFHRPAMLFKPLMPIQFSKPNRIKRKHTKGKKIKELYPTTKDLSLGDNSTSLLLEYAEEHPMVMSQIGMGVKVINYYRRKTKDDTSRPKSEIGDTAVLLPEDKSPFHIFGHIEPGETVKALYNTMYRAPIFEQEPRSQDFLVVKSTTGMHGTQYFLRNVDHLCVVGQEFPSINIPTPHSRVVTTTSKNRLKAISFRIIRRKKNKRLRVEDVTKHFPDTTDMQNRQKMKEFMTFSKEHKEWEMKQGEYIPDEEQIQNLIKPEDVCLLEATQVGQQYLHDAGYGDDDEDEDDEKEGENQSLEQELAPWKQSKNFLQATQGKAMLKLHGEGDPSGRGEAFSFIKTSMKGGFKAIGESVMDKLAEKKELGGHSYNVARQQRAYEDSIRRVWDAQKAALSSTLEHSDAELDDGVDGMEENVGAYNRPTSRSQTATPAPFARRDDASVTSFSRRSVNSQSQKFLRITRTVRKGDQQVTEEYIEEDPAVIKQYRKRRKDLDMATSAYVEKSLLQTTRADRNSDWPTRCLRATLSLMRATANGMTCPAPFICLRKY
jgi:transcription initiation factor TFIID subunit 1, fungi type